MTNELQKYCQSCLIVYNRNKINKFQQEQRCVLADGCRGGGFGGDGREGGGGSGGGGIDGLLEALILYICYKMILKFANEK